MPENCAHTLYIAGCKAASTTLLQYEEHIIDHGGGGSVARPFVNRNGLADGGLQEVLLLGMSLLIAEFRQTSGGVQGRTSCHTPFTK